MAATRFVIANINPGQLRMEYVLSVKALDRATKELADADLAMVGDLLNGCGPYLDDGRNRCVEAARAMEEEWETLLFIDSDIEFTVQDVIDLLTFQSEQPEERPIVGGTYFSSNGSKFFTVAYRLDKGSPTGPYVSIPIKEIEEAVETGRDIPVRVDAIGTGFMAIRRELLESFAETWHRPQPWFAELVTELDDGTPVHMGEDLTFCARAESMGYPMWLHQGVRLVHYKTVGLAYQSAVPAKEEVV